MICYDENNSNTLLYRINPLVKIYVLMLMSIMITFDYKPYMSMVFFVSGIMILVLFGEFSLKEVLKLIGPFFILAVGFCGFTLITRGLRATNNYDVSFLFFKWKYYDIIISIALGFRMLSIILYSIIFVVSTNPVDFILSMIKYLHLPYKIGYAVLTAYRFLPTFFDELQSIKFAHEVRGGNDFTGLKGKFKSLKLCLIPMLAGAVRKGERVSIAMEARAFGVFNDRSYYRNVTMKKLDIATIFFVTIFLVTILMIFIKYNLVRFSLGFNLN